MNDFIDENKNIILKDLSKEELLDIIIEINNYYLSYRDCLNLDSDITFGTEIEYEGLLKSITDKFIKKNLSNWLSKHDGSLESGGEIISPIMKDNKECYLEIKKVCDFLNKYNVNTSKNAGGHIHIGAHIFDSNEEYWKNFIKLYSVYESIIFRFIYGDKISARKGLIKYAKPVSDKMLDALNKTEKALFDLKYYLKNIDRYSAVNFSNVRCKDYHANNTIEFRCPNATSNHIIWQNNINLFSKLLMRSKKEIDNDYYDYIINNDLITYKKSPYLYDMVNLKLAIEFADLIFDNNLDKAYFLRQYLKDFSDNYNIKTVVKAKRFVK